MIIKQGLVPVVDYKPTKTIKVRLVKNHPAIYKDSKKLVGILRHVYIDEYYNQRGIIFFPFLNKRFDILLHDLVEMKK